MRYNNIYKNTNRKPRKAQFGKFERPEVEKMQSKKIQCWKCEQWVDAKPTFIGGLKKFKYFDTNGEEHPCKI